MPVTTTQVLFRREPRGLPVREDFDIVRAELPAVGSGQLLVRGLYLSVEPYMINHALKNVPAERVRLHVCW
jgi:NADPH-dependent curcumin reductase CurA